MGFFDLFKSNKTKEDSNQTKQLSRIPEEELEKSFDNCIDNFVKGDFSDSFNTNLMFKKDEYLVLSIPGVSYCEERSIKIKGSHQGFSVRIMKGLSYRFGTFEGTKEQQVVQLDGGDFILTNKRLIFSGETKSVEYPISKIVTIDSLDNGIRVNRTGKTKMEYYYNTTNLSIKITIEPDKDQDWEKDTVEYEMTGFELTKIIQKLVQKD